MNKKIKVLSVILGIVSLIMVTVIILFAVQNMRIQRLRGEYEQLRTLDESQKSSVYVATSDIKAGDIIATKSFAEAQNSSKENTEGSDRESIVVSPVESNVSLMSGVYTSFDAEVYINESDIGKTALVDIPAGSPILKGNVKALRIQPDTREYEIAVARIMTDQANNDYVDVRILFPDGSDYLVLTKKPVKNLDYPNSIFFTYLDEDEIDRFASAIIDAYTISGTKIYTTRYVAGNLQDEAIPNYIVRSNVQDLIVNDPNIIESATQCLNQAARIDLENRLGNLTADQLKAVSGGQGIADTANSQVIKNNVSAYEKYNESNRYYEDEVIDTDDAEEENDEDPENSTEDEDEDGEESDLTDGI